MGSPINDGEYHSVKVIKEGMTVTVYVDETKCLEHTFTQVEDFFTEGHVGIGLWDGALDVQEFYVNALANEDIAVIKKGEIDCTVSGNVVTVTSDVPCKVGYWDEAAGKYVAIAAEANDDGSYSFTAPKGVVEVLVVVKGDANSNGGINVVDITTLARSLLTENNVNYAALEAWQQFAADVNCDGSINVRDITALAKSQLSETNDNYEALTW